MMFQRYQSLPKFVEAVQFTEENKDRVFNSLTGQYASDFEDGKPVIKVTTIHGEVTVVRLGDWVVKDAKPGTYYPIKDEIFRDGYVQTTNQEERGDYNYSGYEETEIFRGTLADCEAWIRLHESGQMD